MSLFSLVAMVLWGMILCLGYQLFLPHAEKTRTVFSAFLLYGGAGMICFFSTALFLYVVSGGAWGIYGFFALLAGFGLYYRFLRRGGRKIADVVDSALEKVWWQGKRFGRKFADTASFPFGKIVDKGVTWAEKQTKNQENNSSDQGGIL